MRINQITDKVIGAAIKVHRNLGPGLLESAYHQCLYYELQKNVNVRKEYPLSLIYEDVKLECGYRADLFVENKVIVELKAVDELNDLHLAQVLTYLKIANCQVGLLLNFNVLKLTNGLRRVVNNYSES